MYESCFQTVSSHSSRRWYLLLLSSRMGTATFNSSLWTQTFCFYALHNIPCLQSTVSPHTVLASLHVVHANLQKVTYKCGSLPSTKKKPCSVLIYSPLTRSFSWPQVPQRNHPGRRCRALALGTKIRKASKTCDSAEAFKQASRRQ